MKQLTETKIWQSLKDHAHSLAQNQQKEFTLQDSERHQQFTVTTGPITLHYARQRCTTETLDLLFELAQTCDLKNKINALMRGEPVNRSENRPALHTALRAPTQPDAWLANKSIMEEIINTRENICDIAQQLRSQKWLGSSGKTIRDIVNIGIGGSDLGPRFCIKAFTDLSTSTLNYHFISDADPKSFERTVRGLDPETTVFIVSSKSFTTRETLYNAKKAMAWLGHPYHYDRHFIAVTAYPEKAQQLGFKNILPIWEWVGGRYSLCSAVNLITAIAIGPEQFNALLAGAHFMDEHFRNQTFHSNLPVLLAVLGLWNINFLNINNLLILSYAQQLEYLTPYLQQLDMESNGKSVNYQGQAVNYATGPILWGGLGNQAQHSYYQLLCQGTQTVSADFVSLDAFGGELINQFCEEKIKVLTEGVHQQQNLHSHIPGQLPLNHIRLADCNAYNIGALIALYEHKIFTQSVIWDINPFDQPGVETAKNNFLMKPMSPAPA